jgi:hypothetical protein
MANSQLAEVIPITQFSKQKDMSDSGEYLSCPVENPIQNLPVIDDELLADIADMSATELSQKYKREYNSHKNRKAKAKKHFSKEFQKFSDFLSHVGRMPDSRKWTLDRIDNSNPKYGPGLVRWALPQTQNNNKGDTIMLRPFPDKPPASLTYWAEKFGVSPDTMRKRKKRGWTDYQVVFGKGHQTQTKFNWSPLLPEEFRSHNWEAAYMTGRQRFQCLKPESREIWLLRVALTKLAQLEDILIDESEHEGYLQERGLNQICNQLHKIEIQYSHWSSIAEACSASIHNRGGSAIYASQYKARLPENFFI